MSTFWGEHGTKIYGSATAVLGTIQALQTTGAFNELLTKSQLGWLGILCAILTAALGGAVVTRGWTNTTQVRVAEAMQTAIQAQPGALPSSVATFSETNQ